LGQSSTRVNRSSQGASMPIASKTRPDVKKAQHQFDCRCRFPFKMRFYIFHGETKSDGGG
jgi:hypothetical protein